MTPVHPDAARVAFIRDDAHDHDAERRDCDIRARRKGGETLQSIATDYGLTRERVRQIASGMGRPSAGIGKGAPGVKRGTRPGSRMEQLGGLAVGDSFVEETTLETWGTTMRGMNPPTDRRPVVMQGWEFATRLYTGVGTAAGDVRYFVRVERVR